MKEYLIYRSGRLHCIINASAEAEATLKMLEDCYPLDDFEMIEKPEGKFSKILLEVKK